ncbi:unnamed protein product [Cuscuta epithymum]|uniref:DUF7953 domain-containing protein n=1 Tax=Cuscuta epithymum TaxID=186058 RepID=A0AAV0ELR4_9ASTE|nr:unnamed protein product [Cuscuta epithymum]
MATLGGVVRLKLRIVFILLWYSSILLSWVPAEPAANVTLQSIEIFQTHEPDNPVVTDDPEVYFKCEGDQSPTSLSSVVKINVTYNNFTQLTVTQLSNSSDCKTCKVYDKDTFGDDNFGSPFQLCASNFASNAGVWPFENTTEFSAVFSCPTCASFPPTSGVKNARNWTGELLITILAAAFFMFGGA